MIIDGNALVHRAFHALPSLSTKDGKIVNAVYGFTTVLLKALKELKPTYAAVTFDLPKPTFRHELYKEYKATRIKQPQELYDQLPLVKQVVKAFGIPVVEKEGVEADDVIATLSSEFTADSSQPIETVIVTGDLDTLQLVDKSTKVYSFRKGFSDTVIYDEAAVQERYGLSPAQMTDFKALRGDPSDNIPGVKGIGEKTAAELIRDFGNVEDLYQEIERAGDKVIKKVRPKTIELLRTYKEDALLGKKLVQLVRDVPISVSLADCKIPPQDTQKLREIFEKFEFKNLLARLDKEEVAAGRELAQKEQTSLLGGNNVAATLRSPQDNGSLKTAATSYVRQNGTIIGHDLKQLLRDGTLQWNGEKLFDIMIASYLLHPGSRAHDFESVTKEHLRDQVTAKSDLVTVLHQLVSILREELKKEKLDFVFENIEMPLIPVLAVMEERGIKVDVAYLKKLSHEFSKELARLTKKIHESSGQEFNINSPAQLREMLFDKLKLAPVSGRVKKTAKGGVASTAAGELEKLRGSHPIVDLIFEYRELAKLQSTYTDALIALVNKKDGRLRTTFNQAVTATGRLSSSNPNLQNIPIRSKTGRQIRKAFIAERGFKLLSADYSQIELRIAASLSSDAQMIKAFNSGEDFHTKTAALVFGKSEDKITSEMRRNAKAINFGIVYGMGAKSLAQSTGLSRQDAEQFIERYFEVFSTLHDYLEGLKEKARILGYVETLFGRRRFLPEINSGVQQVRAAAERMAQNMPIQGTSADLMKMAMTKLYEQFTVDSSQFTGVRMLLQVHDELVFEGKEGAMAEITPKIKSIMENIHSFKVPIVVDIKQGKNWGEMETL